MKTRWIHGFFYFALAGCAHPPAAVVLSGVTRVAVLPPRNQTGDELNVSGASALEKYVLKEDRVTVPDILADEARFQLAQRGFTVVPPNTVGAAVLSIEVRRWEADAPTHPQYIIAGVELKLIDPVKDCILWEARRPARPQATPGVVVLGDAHVSAARAVMEELFRSLDRKPAR